MAFNSLSYAIFLVVAFILSWGLARFRMLRLTMLLLASWFFYMNAKAVYILLILGSTLVDYTCGIQIAEAKSKARKKLFLTLSLVTNLGLLGTFKYYDFFLDSIRTVLVSMGWFDESATFPFLRAALPVGISFYTFQTMAYSIDIFRGDQKPIRNFVKFALFVSFFPQLVAGPIVLASHLIPQFERPPQLTRRQLSEGIFLTIKGLIKKVAIADFLGINLVDRIYARTGDFTSAEVLLGLFAYSMQIYCDFSGYTDLARGSGKFFGYELPINFQRPYQAESVAKFWRRWHMTLSLWVRHYIYFPLGGTRKGDTRAYINIMVVLIVMGLWHGANWTFFWYGVFHGFVVCVNRYHNQRRVRLKLAYDLTGWNLIWRVAFAFLFVSVARVLFRGQNLDEAWRVFIALFGPDWGLDHIHWKIWLVLAVSFAVHWSPKRWVDQAGQVFVAAPWPLQGIALGIMTWWMVYLSNTQPVPFIYFAF